LPEATHCIVCKIKNCEELKEISANYCFSCKGFPCARLKQLDKRYRTKYGMSMIDNLKRIKETGIHGFRVLENKKWTCEKCGDIICVHTWKCTGCGHQVKLHDI